MSLYSVQAVVVLDSQGKRILAKYYDTPPGTSEQFKELEKQQAFEKVLHSKTNRVNGDVIILENHLVVYKQVADVLLYFVSPPEENEAMMYQVLMALRDALDLLLEHQFDRSTLQEHYDLLALAVDETIDNGIILETDAGAIASRVTKKSADEPTLHNVDFSEKGLKNILGFASDRLSQAMRSQFG